MFKIPFYTILIVTATPKKLAKHVDLEAGSASGQENINKLVSPGYRDSVTALSTQKLFSPSSGEGLP